MILKESNHPVFTPGMPASSVKKNQAIDLLCTVQCEDDFFNKIKYFLTIG
jgi:hypothetical protein